MKFVFFSIFTVFEIELEGNVSPVLSSILDCHWISDVGNSKSPFFIPHHFKTKV